MIGKSHFRLGRGAAIAEPAISFAVIPAYSQERSYNFDIRRPILAGLCSLSIEQQLLLEDGF